MTKNHREEKQTRRAPLKINANSSATLAIERFKKALSLNPITSKDEEHYREALMEDALEKQD
ncbi:MAG: hypothetical protein ACOY9Y_13220 [Bacillota bacterium]